MNKRCRVLVLLCALLVILSACGDNTLNLNAGRYISTFERAYTSLSTETPIYVKGAQYLHEEVVTQEDIYCYAGDYWQEKRDVMDSWRSGELFVDGSRYYGSISSLNSFPLRFTSQERSPDFPWQKSWEQIQGSVKSIEKQDDILYIVCEDETYILKFSIRNKRIEKIEYEDCSLSVTDGSGQEVKVKTAKQYDICYVDESVVADQLARHLDCVEVEYTLTTQYFELSEELDPGTEFTITAKDATELTQQELVQIEQQFFNSPESSNIGQRFLFSWYNTPEDVNLLDIFSGGSRLGNEFSVKEFDSLVALYGDMGREDLRSITTLEMNDILQKYIGIPLKQTNARFLDYLTYLDEYDTYYMAHNDTNMCQIKLLKGYRNADGTVAILYERQCMYAWYSELGVVTLRQAPTELGYYFTSNLPYGTETE